MCDDEANTEVVDGVADDVAAIVTHLRWWIADPSVPSNVVQAARLRWAVWALSTMADALGTEATPAMIAGAIGCTPRQAGYALQRITKEPPPTPEGTGRRVLRLAPEGADG